MHFQGLMRAFGVRGHNLIIMTRGAVVTGTILFLC